MAKNYTFSEAVAIIAEGKDMEAIQDLGRRYPIMVQKTAIVAAKAGEDFVELMGFMPEYLTANKVNTGIKNSVFGDTKETGDADTDEDAGDEEETETESGDTGRDYESMSGKELWAILGKAGLRKTAKSTKKPDLVAACKAMDAKGTESDAEDESEDDGDEETGNPYEGKSAMELFKECKKRGLKAAPKKPASFYANILIEADAAKSEGDDETEDEEWDEEETKKETKKASAKGAKSEKAEKKTAGKAKAAKEKEDDGDDDWDI